MSVLPSRLLVLSAGLAWGDCSAGFSFAFSAFLFETLTGSVRVFCYHGGKGNNKEDKSYEKRNRLFL